MVAASPVGHAVELGAADGAIVGCDSEFPRDRHGCARMVAGDQDCPDAGGLRPRDGCARLRARRIDHANQPQKDEVALERIGATGGGPSGIAGVQCRNAAPSVRSASAASTSVTRRICARRAGVNGRLSCPLSS